MKTNIKKPTRFTHEGAPSTRVLTPTQELRRTILCMMLFEDNFYESGVDAATRVRELVKQVPFDDLAQIAIDAREKQKLRHVPLLILREMLRYHGGRQMGDLIHQVIQRPDEIGELLALYRKENPKAPLTAQLKRGIARAFGKFNEYSLAKNDKGSAAFRLRDAMFLTHPRPAKGKEELYKRIADDKMETPDTWEVRLSGGADKGKTFEGMIRENKLGALAYLRNLRNMIESGVDEDLIREGLGRVKTDRVLPFRFITAARYAPRLEDALEQLMFKCLAEQPELPGKTAILIDHSGSMRQLISAKSEISRFDAAAALAVILREVCDRCRVFTFSDRCIEVPPRRGFALIQAVKDVVNPTSTLLGKAVKYVYSQFPECERLLVITDEQSHDRPSQPQGRGYIVNVAGYRNGIGYGSWLQIDGWSEAILDYIREFEILEEA